MHDMQDMGEVVVGLLVLLGFCPILLEHPAGHVEERFPLAVLLEPELVVGNQVALGAIAEPRLHLTKDRRMDVLVVPGHAADVENDGEGIHASAEVLPSGNELLPPGGVIP
jgi:hypothetical protein